jgi:hypothetical protein
MRWLSVAVAVLIAPVVLPAAGDEARTFTFSKGDASKLPRGWKADHTGKGQGSVWKVVADDTAPSKTGYALAQTVEGPAAFFNLCVVEGTRYADLEISVSFKAVKGKEDQGGGVVWRYRDANNYYVARMNPLEDNFRVYKVVGGRRTQLATTRDDIKVPVGTWHSIKVTMKGAEIKCFLDGKKRLEAKDATFKEAGKVGLWSKADAQTRFDELTVRGK